MSISYSNMNDEIEDSVEASAQFVKDHPHVCPRDEQDEFTTTFNAISVKYEKSTASVIIKLHKIDNEITEHHYLLDIFTLIGLGGTCALGVGMASVAVGLKTIQCLYDYTTRIGGYVMLAPPMCKKNV
jgi:uncharacterized membrane protein YqgA involved in biofilm formation